MTRRRRDAEETQSFRPRMSVAKWERNLRLRADSPGSTLRLCEKCDTRCAAGAASGADTRTRRPVLRRGHIGFRAKDAKTAKKTLCDLGVLCARNSSPESSREISRRVSAELEGKDRSTTLSTNASNASTQRRRRHCALSRLIQVCICPLTDSAHSLCLLCVLEDVVDLVFSVFPQRLCAFAGEGYLNKLFGIIPCTPLVPSTACVTLKSTPTLHSM